MGEKIKDITQIQLGGGVFMLELNEPLGIGRERQIHIQNQKFRFECPESDMLAMLCNIIKAKKELNKIKGGGENEELLWETEL